MRVEVSVSCKDMNRPELKEMLGYVRVGNTVIVETYSRLSRSTKDLVFIIGKL